LIGEVHVDDSKYRGSLVEPLPTDLASVER
jgi:hypothetical protein